MAEDKKNKTENINIETSDTDKVKQTDEKSVPETGRGVTVTSDDKNASSAHAMPKSNRSAADTDPDIDADDDILAVIRRRKAAARPPRAVCPLRPERNS